MTASEVALDLVVGDQPLTGYSVGFNLPVGHRLVHLGDVFEGLARAKAGAVAARHPTSWVIGADQVAVIDGRILGKPGDDSFGTIAQGFVESSNVSLNEELINLLIAQRAYQMNSKVIQASDEMLGITNNLRR